MNTNYFFKNTKEECVIADAIQHIPNLTLRERFYFCKAPLNAKGLYVYENSKSSSK